jgi:NADPH:quinone reductase-like Zn-dependent oxidoreductase
MLRECSSGQTYDVVLTSVAAASYLDQLKALGLKSGQVVVAELETSPIPSPSSKPTLGAGRILVRGGKCGV